MADPFVIVPAWDLTQYFADETGTDRVTPTRYMMPMIYDGQLGVENGGTGVDGFEGGGFVIANGTDPFTIQANIFGSQIDLTGYEPGILYADGTSFLSLGTLLGVEYGGTGNDSFDFAGYVKTPGGSGQLTSVLTIPGTDLDMTVYGDGVLWVNGGSLAGSATTDMLPQGTVNFYFTEEAARDALSEGTGIDYDNTTGVIRIDPAYVGQNTITTLGTISTGTWAASVITPNRGGTGQSSWNQGDMLYSGATNTLNKLAGNTSTTKQYLSSTGDGANANAPAWSALSANDIGSGTLGVARGGTGTGTQFTAGSLVFAGASGVYTQDNSNLFWDDSNNRLGLGTASPNRPIHLRAGTPEMQFTDSDTNKDWHIGLNTNDFSITETGVANRIVCLAGGNIGFNGQSFGSGTGGVIFIANCSAVPTTNPSGGGLLYVTGGALRYRGSSGTVSNLGAA